MRTRPRQRPRKRATVRKPVWATMRWSGRTAWPSMCQPRCSTSIVRASIHVPRSASRDLGGLRDRRRVGDEDPAGLQHALGVRDDLPRLGQVEHDAVERPVVGIDALVAVARARRGSASSDVLAEEAAHVAAGPVGEVLAQLVADDLGAVAQHRHRQRARADAGLEHARAGTDVGEHADRRQVLGVDDLGAARHLDHEVLERRAQHGVLRARGSSARRRPPARPMTSAWGTNPAWLWNSPPSLSTTR